MAAIINDGLPNTEQIPPQLVPVKTENDGDNLFVQSIVENLRAIDERRKAIRSEYPAAKEAHAKAEANLTELKKTQYDIDEDVATTVKQVTSSFIGPL
jgi:uncharacterized protein (DUF3084 family)